MTFGGRKTYPPPIPTRCPRGHRNKIYLAEVITPNPFFPNDIIEIYKCAGCDYEGYNWTWERKVYK